VTFLFFFFFLGPT